MFNLSSVYAQKPDSLKGSWYLQTLILHSDTIRGGFVKFNEPNQLVVMYNSYKLNDTLSWEMITDSTLIVNISDPYSQHNELIVFDIVHLSDIKAILSGYGKSGFVYLSLFKE